MNKKEEYRKLCDQERKAWAKGDYKEAKRIGEKLAEILKEY